MAAASEAETTGKRVLEVDLGPPLGIRSFTTVEEVRKWIADEVSAWEWVQQAVPTFKPLREVRNRSLFRQGEIEQEFAQIDQRPQDADFVQLRLATVGAHLRERYIGQKAFHSSTPEAMFASSQSDQVVGVGAMFGFLGLDIAAPASLVSRVQEGIWLAFAFKRALIDKAPATGEAYAQLVLRIQSESDHQRKVAGDLADQFKLLKADIEAAKLAQATSFSVDQSKRGELFDQVLKDGNERMEAISRTVRNELALRGPVEYFESKADTHRNLAFSFGAVSLIAGVGVVYGIWQLVEPFVVAPKAGGEIPQLHLVEIALLLFLTTMAIWLLRILIRLTLGNIHLQTDLKIRGMLVKAYLALLEGDKALKDDDRELVLRILFRPTADGIVRDDAAPVTPAEVLSRFFAK